MISLLRGQIVESGSNHVIVDVGGVGYKVFVTADALHTLKRDSEVLLWTHLAVREDAMDLYGFVTKREKEFFELLISVSGIGPKSALNVLSLVSVDALGNAIRTGSVAHLVKVSGIGRKTAEKIVLELKDKLGSIGSDGGSGLSAEMTSDMDAIEALRALGYDTDEAREALKKVSAKEGKDTDTGAKVKAALKVLS